MSFENLRPITWEYLIVEFPDEISDNSIPMAIISSSWVTEQEKNLFCYWPSYIKSTNKREKAVINHEMLDKEKCSLCPIRIKYSSDNYGNISAKLKAMEEAIESQESEPENRRHRINKHSDYAYSSDELDDMPPLPPKAPPLPLPQNTKQFIKRNDASRLDSDVLQYASSDLRNTHSAMPSSIGGPNNCGISSQNSFLELQNRSIPNIIGNSTDSTGSIQSSANFCTSCKSNKAVLTEMVKSMEKLREDIKFLIQLNQDKEQEFVGTYDEKSFESIEELTRFDKKLGSEEYFQKSCMQLSLLGGKDGAATTRNILAALISHKLALNLNWSGRNDKDGLKDYTLVVKCIAVAVRRNPNSRATTNEEIYSTMKAWLRNACDRAGGRAKRTAKNISE